MSNNFGVDLNQLFKKVQNNPASIWLLLGIIGMGLILLIGGDNRQNTQYTKNATLKDTTVLERQSEDSATKESEMEKELASILSRISGAGVVRVNISLKSANRKIWERQTRVNKRLSQQQGETNTEESSSDELVFAKDREGKDSPILKEELAPEIQGVLIVASGAQDSSVKQLLGETVMTILDLPAHRVMVIDGKED